MSRTASNLSVVSAAALLQIVVQFLIQRAIAGIFGADVEADALAAALAVPTLLAAIITGSLSYGLVPEMVRSFGNGTPAAPQDRRGDAQANEHKTAPEAERSHRSPADSAWHTASFVGLCTVGLSCLGAGALAVWAPLLCRALYGQLPDSQLQLVSELLWILSPQVVFSGLISWTTAIHHSRQRFLWPALGGVLGTGLTLALAVQVDTQGITDLAWAINAGSLLSAAIQVTPILGLLRLPRIDRAAAGRLSGVLLPLVVGAIFLRLDPLLDRMLASQLAETNAGAIAHVHYAQRIMAALLAIGTSSLAVVAFPQLAAELAGRGQLGFTEHFGLAFRRLILIIAPVTIGFGCFAVWIIRDLLQHGAFTANDSFIVGWLTILHLGMFAGASCAELFARGYYVLGDSRTPTIIGVAALLLSWVIKLWLFWWIGIWGIALGVSAYCLLSSGGMAVGLTRRCGWGLWCNARLWATHAVVASLVACAASWMAYQWVPGGTWSAAVVGGAMYFIALLSLENRDAKQLADRITER